jgi:outer membrane protein
MKRVILVLLILFFLIYPLARAEEVTLTFNEAIAIALRDNSDILLKSEDIQKAKAKLAEANAGLFPTLTFTGGWNYTKGFYPKYMSEISTQSSLRYYLYTGGRTINTIKSSKYGITVSEALLDKARLDIAFSTERTFYTLLLANEFTRLNKQILENTKKHLDFVEARYKSGQASDSQILSIKRSLSDVERAYEASLNQVEASVSLLRNLLHLDEKVIIKPQGKFAYEPREVAFDDSLLKAIRQRPEIRQFEAQEGAAKAGVQIAKSQGRPSIYASWDYYSSSRQSADYSPNPTKGWEDYNIIGLTFSWPIFDGWATKAKVDQAIVDLKEAQILKDKTTRDIALELKNAYLDLRNTIARIKSTESEVVLYADNLRVAKEEYTAGIASSLNVDDVTLAYNVALYSQQQTLYDYIIAGANFDKATGGR